MAKVTITNSEKKGSGLGVEVFLNGKSDGVLAPGASEAFDVTLGQVVTATEVKLQTVKTKK